METKEMKGGGSSGGGAGSGVESLSEKGLVEPTRGKRKTSGNVPPGPGAEKEETLKRAAAWMEEEREAGKKVSVRSAASKFGVSKTTLHRFRLRNQSSGMDLDKTDVKDEDMPEGKKLDKLGIQFLLDSQRGAESGGRGPTEVETEPVLSTSSASAKGRKPVKRGGPGKAGKFESGQEAEERKVTDSEELSSSSQHQAWLQNLDREIYQIRSTVAKLNERVVALEEQNSRRAHASSRGQIATTTG